MENQNSCAFCGIISEVIPIKDTDKIIQYKVGEYSIIGGKDFHKVGDKVGVAVTDAVIPEPMIEKLGIKNYLRKGCRVKTVKLKGVYSEALMFEIDSNYREGQDLMVDFNIIKYEEPIKQIQLADGTTKKYKDNPNFHVYYKFPNFKNAPEIFTEKDIVVITRKIHGTNARYGIIKKEKLSLWDRFLNFFNSDPWRDYSYIYGSHRVEKGSDSQGFYSTDIWRSIGDRYALRDKLWAFVKDYQGDIGSGLIVYGEIYGPGVQKNYDYGLKDIQFATFDVEINDEFVSDYVFHKQMGVLDLPKVEYLYMGNWSKETQDELTTAFIVNTKIPHEGIVVKSVDGNKRKRAKCVSAEYLIYSDKYNISDEH
jgi:RNA ligase (TIGR02306 family)